MSEYELVTFRKHHGFYRTYGEALEAASKAGAVHGGGFLPGCEIRKKRAVHLQDEGRVPNLHRSRTPDAEGHKGELAVVQHDQLRPAGETDTRKTAYKNAKARSFDAEIISLLGGKALGALEIGERLGLKDTSIRPRLTHLKQRGVIRKSDLPPRRLPNGNSEVRWELNKMLWEID